MDTEMQKLLSQPTITVDELGRVLRTGRNATYVAVNRGDFATVRMGKGRILVLTAPLRRQLGMEA